MDSRYICVSRAKAKNERDGANMLYRCPVAVHDSQHKMWKGKARIVVGELHEVAGVEKLFHAHMAVRDSQHKMRKGKAGIFVGELDEVAGVE